MKFIIGKKVNMSQVFTEKGEVVPVTVLQAGPVVVTAVKQAAAKDGYNAVQVGYGARKAKNISKAVAGHVKTLGSFELLKEFRTEGESTLKVGDTLDAATFAKGDTVSVTGVSKSKGFQGVVKRHGFHGGPRSHGQKHSEREPGSISGGTRKGGRVPKGMRMAGRTGGEVITVKNLKIVDIDSANNQILISGAVPGRRGTIVSITA